MQHMNNKGFLLVDSLLTVFIITCMCLLCFSIYELILNYEEGYKKNNIATNEAYESIFNNLPICEECVIDESD